MLWQVESEIRQIGAQITAINATIKPYLLEIADLRDYHKQLVDLQETLQRRNIKPRVVTIAERRKEQDRRNPVDAQTQQLLDVLKGLSPADIARMCANIDEQNGEQPENPSQTFIVLNIQEN